jgi:hypothetical protein
MERSTTSARVVRRRLPRPIDMARCFGLLVEIAPVTARELLDQLAQRIAVRYAVVSARHARLFRARLDQQVRRGGRPLVRWLEADDDR